ncbi:MAG: hypothetical protein GXX99_04025 [Clostridiales bacterium]|nr:hypothetical protein [Clostridiales bacterium]
MGISTSFEVWLACGALLFGMAGMLLYNLFSIWRIAVPAGRRMLFIQDLLYWALLATGCFFFLFVTNRGQPRLFILFFALLGAGVYQLTLGRLLMLVAAPLAAWLRRAALFLMRGLAAPSRWLERRTRAIRRLWRHRYRKKIKKR